MMMYFRDVCKIHELRRNIGEAIIRTKSVIDCEMATSEMKKKAIDIMDELEKLAKECSRIKSETCKDTIKRIKENDWL